MSKIAVVTGASKGIGNAITKKLLKKGWDVYGISRTEASDLTEDAHYRQILFDLANIEDLKQLADKLPSIIDLLINDAGIWELVLIKDVTLPHLDKIINLNLKSPILLTSLLLPRLPSGSQIINISSIMGRYTEPEYGVYASTKAGIDRFTTTLAKERKDLRVIAILPSATDTAANRNVLGENEDYSKYLTPNEVAAIVLRAVNGEFESGDLIVVNNTEFWSMWENRDKYKAINIDK